MKVLNVNMFLDPVTGGGMVERTFQISRSLVRTGIECTILTTDLGLTQERIQNLEGVNIIALPCLNERFYVPRFSFREIKRLVNSTDVVHLMGHWTLINALAYFAAHRLKKPYVVCPAGSLPIYGRSKIIKKIYNYVIGKKIISNANGHIAIGINEIDQFQSYGIDSDKVTVIPNGINAKDFKVNDIATFRKKHGLGDYPLIMFMGRLNFIKGPDLLLRAFDVVKEELKDVHLVFVGPDGGMLTALEKMAVESSASGRIHFIGYLGGTEKSQAYHAADLLVIPSRQEAMSIVVLEAGITGTAVLLTDQCGFEVATINGGLVVPASVNGLQKGLVKILSDHAKLKMMGTNLKKHVENHFTWDVTINKYLNLYCKILGSTK